jgi:hypothetical protein
MRSIPIGARDQVWVKAGGDEACGAYTQNALANRVVGQIDESVEHFDQAKQKVCGGGRVEQDHANPLSANTAVLVAAASIREPASGVALRATFGQRARSACRPARKAGIASMIGRLVELAGHPPNQAVDRPRQVRRIGRHPPDTA